MSAVIPTEPAPRRKRTAYEKLPRRLKRFVDHYVIGATAEAAMRASGYTGRFPSGIGSKWLRKPEVKEAVTEATERHMQEIGVRQFTVIQQMHAIATLDPRKLVDENGVLLPLHKLDAATAAAISSVEIEEVSSNGESGTRYKFKFWDKVKANDKLGQFLELWESNRVANVNVDARSVAYIVDKGSQEAVRILAGVGREIAALGASETPALSDQDRSVLPAALCVGQGGHRTPVDAPQNPGDSERS
jgi:phage terminase small subunit